MAPETMVAAVAQKTVWNIRNVQFQSPPGSVLDNKKCVVPNRPLVAPNISPKPTRKNAIEPMEKSIRFFIRMLTAFFALVKPHSTIAKPGCMKNTRNAATHVHTIFIFNCSCSFTLARLILLLFRPFPRRKPLNLNPLIRGVRSRPEEFLFFYP